MLLLFTNIPLLAWWFHWGIVALLYSKVHAVLECYKHPLLHGTYPIITSLVRFDLCSDLDPDWLYPDPDPQNLMNPDPVRIQVNKITKLISKHLFKVKKKIIIFKSEPKPERLATFLGSEKYNFLRKNCWLNSAYPLILYPWIRIRNPDPDPHHWIYGWVASCVNYIWIHFSF